MVHLYKQLTTLYYYFLMHHCVMKQKWIIYLLTSNIYQAYNILESAAWYDIHSQDKQVNLLCIARPRQNSLFSTLYIYDYISIETSKKLGYKNVLPGREWFRKTWINTSVDILEKLKIWMRNINSQKSRKVFKLPPDKNTPSWKLSSLNNGK